ncbi:MAG: hypothetical protein CM15mP111_2760 [Hyphomicrobiales bacterium]|nr:MAG: hypothetical protein CM15mP111_2760 [Hyphomicrobiales bacterium]
MLRGIKGLMVGPILNYAKLKCWECPIKPKGDEAPKIYMKQEIFDVQINLMTREIVKNSTGKPPLINQVVFEGKKGKK